MSLTSVGCYIWVVYFSCLDCISAQDKRTRTPKYKPQPRYTKPQLPEPNSARTVDFNSTTDIREAVYLDWYAQKMERSKQELKEKKKLEKEAEEKKKKVNDLHNLCDFL